MVLDARLRAIAGFVGTCECVADIGTDHGRLGAWLLKHGYAQKVQFLDISKDSLDKAMRLIDKLHLNGRALFSVGDGADAMAEIADVAVIAGMGGQLIAQIVEKGRKKLGDARLVLQPNVAIMELRTRLVAAGYMIMNERIVRTAGRMYVVIEAAPGHRKYDHRELLVGPCILKNGDPLLNEYAQRQKRITNKALGGAIKGGAEWTDALKWEAGIWEEIINGDCGTIV